MRIIYCLHLEPCKEQQTLNMTNCVCFMQQQKSWSHFGSQKSVNSLILYESTLIL